MHHLTSVILYFKQVILAAFDGVFGARRNTLKAMTANEICFFAQRDSNNAL